jgi:hypothetical protein
MEVSGDKKGTQIYLDLSPVFFHTVPKLVQALVITYDEIFCALAAGDTLLLKPFQDLGFGGACTGPVQP